MAEYDPNKRREYYLKTRELKGRTPGSGESSGGGSSSSSAPAAKPKAPSKEEAALITKKKIEQMKARLKKLRETIKNLVAEAKKWSGTPVKPDAKTAKGAPEVKLTAKQKADAAKRSKENYEKNKKTTGSDEVKDLQAQIDKAVERIKKLKKDLDSSTKSQKPKANKK